jgi:hypothetical protein
MLHAFPLSLSVKTSTVAWGYSNRNRVDSRLRKELTATGIAPDLHRFPILIPTVTVWNQLRGKNRGFIVFI